MHGWPCRLVRGGVELGIITHDPREDAGPGAVAWLQPSPAFEAVRHLFEAEVQLWRPLCDAETGSPAAAELFAKLEAIQGQILGAGVRLIRVENEQVYEVEEIHIEGLKVFWK